MVKSLLRDVSVLQRAFVILDPRPRVLHPRDESLHVLVDFLRITQSLDEFLFLFVRLFHSGRPVRLQLAELLFHLRSVLRLRLVRDVGTSLLKRVHLSLQLADVALKGLGREKYKGNNGLKYTWIKIVKDDNNYTTVVN